MGKSRRGLSSRSAGDYDNEQHGRSETNAPPDDRCLNFGMTPVNVFRPKYKEGPMVFRPFPALDFEKPETMLQPSRKSKNPDAFTQWIVRIPAASYAGSMEKKQLTFLLNHPADKEGKANNPYRILYYAAKQAHDNGRFSATRKWDSDWNKLLKGKEGSGAPLDAPTYKYFTQGAMLQNGEKIFVGDKRAKPFGLEKSDDLCVQELPTSAGRGLYQLLNLELDRYDGDPETDPGCMFKYGDPTGFFVPKKRIIEAGNFLYVFNPKVTKYKGLTGRNCVENDGDLGKGYDIALLDKISLDGEEYFPDIDSAGVDKIFDKVCFWFDDGDSKGLLNIAPIEQQCAWIAAAYANVPKLIQYAWAEHDEFFTEEVLGILKSRVSGSVPGDDDDQGEDRPRRRRGDDDDQDPPPRRRRGDDDDDRPRGGRDATQRRDDRDEEDPPRRRRGDEEEDDAPPSSRRRPAADDQEEEPPRRRRGDEENDDPPPRRRQAAEREDDEPPPRRRQAAEREDDEPPPRRRPAADDQEEEPAPRRRPAAEREDDEPPPRRRPAADDQEEEPAPRRRPAAEQEEEPAPRRRRPAADDQEEEPAPRRRPAAEQEEEPAPRRRPAAAEQEEEPAPRRRRPAADTDDTERDYFPADDAPPAKPAGGRRRPVDDEDEFADKPPRGGKADAALERSAAAARGAKENGGKRNAAPEKEAPKPRSRK